MRIRVISNSVDLLEIKESWENIFMQGDYSVFQSFEYCYSSYLSSENIFIICLYDNSELLELWPLEFIGNRLRLINDTHADFCDILTLVPNNNDIADYLVANQLTKNIKFNNLLKDSNIIIKFKNFKYKALLKQSQFSVLRLLKTDKFPDNFSKFVYRKRRRLQRILKKYFTDHIIFSSIDKEFPEFEINFMRDNMIKLNYRKDNFLDVDLYNVIRSLYLSNKLIISALKLKGNIVAISLIFRDNNTYSFWIDMYDDNQMINLYHNTLFIKYITNRKAAVFNFGRGVYNYKIQNFGPDIFDLYSLELFKNSISKHIYLRYMSIINFLKKIYKLLT